MCIASVAVGYTYEMQTMWFSAVMRNWGDVPTQSIYIITIILNIKFEVYLAL